MKAIITPLFALLLVAGCASTSTLSPAQQKKALAPISCKDGPSCDILWQRSQAWIANNSHWRIQMLSDSLLQTYGPGNDPYLAFTVIREKKQDGGADIVIAARCGNALGCVVAPIDALYNFREYLLGPDN